jgi:DNA-binding FadR family transcriptional regulator
VESASNGRRVSSSRRRIPKVAELVASELRTKILTGELLPGESISTESLLMEEYDVSRPTLREALRLLESQQLITVRRGSHHGPVVTLPDAAVSAVSFAMLLQLRSATLTDIYAFRQIYEPTAARLAAEKATPEEVSALRAILDEETARTDDREAFTVPAWRFHTELVRMSGNITMTLVTEVLEQISQRHAASQVVAITPEQTRLSMKSHAKLVELIAAGRGAEAERHWRRHMQAAADTLLREGGLASIVELLD